ncbi:hypothetical protein HYDPIDRAFT_34599, partial [Hydnomerulius pinastri MD-312]
MHELFKNAGVQHKRPSKKITRLRKRKNKPAASAVVGVNIRLDPLDDDEMEMDGAHGASEDEMQLDDDSLDHQYTPERKYICLLIFRYADHQQPSEVSYLRHFDRQVLEHNTAQAVVPGSAEAPLRCDTCDDCGVVWKCTREGCTMKICVQRNSPGCIKLLGKVRQESFVCPRCMRAMRIPMPYKVESYIQGKVFIERSDNPLWATFLTWVGYRGFGADVRSLQKGNNRPKAIAKDLQWLKDTEYKSDILLFIDTHSEVYTGNLQVEKINRQAICAPITDVIMSYLGQSFVEALAKTHEAVETGLKVVRGLTILTCGPTVRITESFARLKALVTESLFDFVLAFAGQSTMDYLVTMPLARFVENV